jgi:predicted dithiol-disulfide oxidoreductase (DUF899 family)
MELLVGTGQHAPQNRLPDPQVNLPEDRFAVFKKWYYELHKKWSPKIPHERLSSNLLTEEWRSGQGRASYDRESEVRRDLTKNRKSAPDANGGTMKDIMKEEPSAPAAVDRAAFQAQLDALRDREKAHTHEGDAIAAARRRLPMVEVDGATPLIGERGKVTLSDAFGGRRQLIAYYFMWNIGKPAPEQCEGCTWVTTQVTELSYLHSRDVTFAVFCQGPYEESARYRNFMGWEMPWYSAPLGSLKTLLVGRQIGRMHLVCYVRKGSKFFETYWTKIRGVEAMDNSYRLLDLTVYGRQEIWEDSPAGWPQGDIVDTLRTKGRPTAQWSRFEAGRSDNLGTNPLNRAK